MLSIFSSLSEEEIISNPFDYARITDVDYTAVVVDQPNSNGKIIVTERLTFDIHAASKDNPFWELWRDLPEDYIDGLKIEYKVNSVKQILEDGSTLVYTESPKLYWNDSDYTSSRYGPGKWYHSEGPYDEDDRQYECVFFYVDGLYREKVTFEIEYEMTNAALRYNDCSELYLCFYSEDSIKYLKSFKGQILFPNKDMPSSGNYYAHTYGTNSDSFDFTESKTVNPGYHTFSFDLDETELKFKPYNQYIEFSLVSYGKDKHIFTNYAPDNYYSDEDVLEESKEEHLKYESLSKKFAKTKIVVFVLCSIGAFLIILYSLNTDKRMKKKHVFYEPTMQMEYFRDIPSNLDANFAAQLIFCKDQKQKDNADGYAATMLSLVRKDYIELDRIDQEKDWNSNNIKIIVKYKPIQLTPETLDSEPVVEPIKQLEPLTQAEEYYFNLIVRHSHGNEISMNVFEKNVLSDYENTNTFVKNVDNSIVNIGISQGYFQKADYRQPKQQLLSLSKTHLTLALIVMVLVNLISYQTRLDLAFGGFFILGFAFIISSLYLKKIAKKYILLTQFGEDEYAKWKGLYNFLNSETLMNERTVIELPIWEQYLVYATAFGISEKVIAALKIRCPDIDMSPMLRNPYYSSTSFRHNSRSFRSATRSASHIARSGGYGGHGGYGGGGRGGGGGRRRSLIYK